MSLGTKEVPSLGVFAAMDGESLGTAEGAPSLAAFGPNDGASFGTTDGASPVVGGPLHCLWQ